MITKRQMGLAMPTAASSGRLELWFNPLTGAMQRHNITTAKRISAFLANMAVETGELQARGENLHYSAERLQQVFPSLFDSNPGLAEELAAQGPEAIANYIYADAHRPPSYRLGNPNPGDGWRNRGRGPMEITGGDNYRAYFRSVGLPEDSDRDLLLQPQHGAESAAAFWEHAGCNELADAGNFTGTVVKVNGGTNGLAQRQMYEGRFTDALAHPDPVPPIDLPAAVPPVPEALPPVTTADLKPPPQLEPVPAPPPVPPPGFSVQPSGNVVIDDIKKSEIVKGANVGQVVTATAGTVSVAAGAASQLKGLLGTGVSDVAAIVLGVVALAAMAFAFWYFRSIKASRVAMHDKGIA